MEQKNREKILSTKDPNNDGEQKYTELIKKQDEIPMFIITKYKMQEFMTKLLRYDILESFNILEFEKEFGIVMEALNKASHKKQFEYDKKDKIYLFVLTLMHGSLSSVKSIFHNNDSKYEKYCSKIRAQYIDLSKKCYQNIGLFHKFFPLKNTSNFGIFRSFSKKFLFNSSKEYILSTIQSE